MLIEAVLALGMSGVPVPSSQAPGGMIQGDSVAIGHISAALRRPPALRIPPVPDVPVFRVTVRASPTSETALDAARQELADERRQAPAPMNIPGVAKVLPYTNLIYVAQSIARKINEVRRDREVRQIRESVDEEVAAFCIVYDCAVPNEGLILPAAPGP